MRDSRARGIKAKIAFMARVILRIDITREAFANLQKASDRFGMTQVSMLSRFVEAFAEQDQEVQSVILHGFPKIDAAKLLLNRLTKSKQKKL